MASVDEGLDLSPVGEAFGPLNSCIQTLKPLRLSPFNGVDLHWNLKVFDGRSEEGFKSVSSLGNLGFISPINEKVANGSCYFLRSCSKLAGRCLLKSSVGFGRGISRLCSDGLPLKDIDQNIDFGALRVVLSPVRVTL